MLGQASRSDHVRHLPLHRLSREGVQQVSEGSGVNAADLFALTSGNPFFVHELLVSAQDERVPPTIAEAVLARVRSLDPATQDVLEQLAVVPSAIERWLADALVPGPGAMAALAAAEERGLLTVSARKISFRHELTRRAITTSVPAVRLMALSQHVLSALTGHDGSDVSQIVHHAAQAGDRDAIVRYGPAAARDAVRAGAHREAVAHFALVLEHEGRFAAGERAELLEQYAIECYTIGAAGQAAEAERHAVDLNRSLGDLRKLGASLRWLSRMSWWAGDRSSAEQASQEAIGVLEQAGDARLLALALASNQSQLCMLANRNAEAIAYGEERATALSRAAGDAEIPSHALTNIGSAQWNLGDPAGQATLDEALRTALAAGDAEDACRAYVNMIWNLLDWFRLDEAERYLAAAMKFAEETEFLGFLSYMHAERARLEFARGAWAEAVRAAEHAMDAFIPTRCTALIVLGRIAARRGRPEATSLLSAAWELAVRAGELQRMGPAAAARAEDAWLHGDHTEVRGIAAPVYQEARQLADQVHEAELGYWLTKAGQPRGRPPATLTRYRLLDGGVRRPVPRAAAGCPYERAAALAESPDPGDLFAALALLDELGAIPLATLVRGRLRTLGATRIPRGPRGETRTNPAGLTPRQLDVLRLLGKGYTNAQIASQLVVSVRTVDSHVAAVLTKLGVASRREAAACAAELGVLDAENR